ncbi:hypothetical protein ACWCXH_37425 [Kitasatospora sp. NPDC001660]
MIIGTDKVILSPPVHIPTTRRSRAVNKLISLVEKWIDADQAVRRQAMRWPGLPDAPGQGAVTLTPLGSTPTITTADTPHSAASLWGSESRGYWSSRVPIFIDDAAENAGTHEPAAFEVVSDGGLLIGAGWYLVAGPMGTVLVVVPLVGGQDLPGVGLVGGRSRPGRATISLSAPHRRERAGGLPSSLRGGGPTSTPHL